MYSEISRAAERAASCASRRAFLGRFGGTAMATAAALGGILALPNIGEAARKPPRMCLGGDTGCIGSPVGSRCGGGRDGGGYGTCQPPKHDRDSTSCECR